MKIKWPYSKLTKIHICYIYDTGCHLYFLKLIYFFNFQIVIVLLSDSILYELLQRCSSCLPKLQIHYRSLQQNVMSAITSSIKIQHTYVTFCTNQHSGLSVAGRHFTLNTAGHLYYLCYADCMFSESVFISVRGEQKQKSWIYILIQFIE